MNLDKKKILFILPSLKAGGAERVISFLAQNIDKSKFETTLLVLGFEKDKTYDTSNVRTVFFNKTRLLSSSLPVLKYIIKSKPNIVFSSVIHINLFTGFLAFFFKKIKFLARESSVISYASNYNNISILKFKFLIKKIYNNFHFIICQSNDMLVDINRNYGVKSSKLVLINNPITKNVPLGKSRERKVDYVKFITVGRLVTVKGYRRLFYILAKIKSYNFTYTICGEGPMKEELEKLAKELNIYSKINFISYTNKVYIELKKHHVFLQGSYVEGFPNAVLESCLVGTPVIAFDAPGGTREIILNGVNGYMVKDDKEFYQKLSNINNLLSLSPKNIKNHVENKFNSKKIINKYEKLFS